MILINTVGPSACVIVFCVLSTAIYIAILLNYSAKVSSSASTEKASLNIRWGFNPVLAQSRWLRTCAVLVKPRTGRMRAGFQSLIIPCYSVYSCQNYCYHSLGSRSLLWTFHSANLPVSSAMLTSVAFFFKFIYFISGDVFQTSAGTIYRNVGLSATVIFRPNL